ncbi:MAG TPA: LLM class flavin-dependent oxidoreductase, partial [Terriglobia bacterium]|nr:LLM class flavin-dependent oxidoreductase [Terriglobia bacterium]
IGIGPRSPAVMAEYAACGADFHRRGALLEEGLRIMKALWTGQPCSFTGEFYRVEQVRLHPLPARPGGPPVLMAAAADPALRRVARLADGWLPISPTPESFARDWEAIVNACRAIQRDPATLSRILYTTLNVNQDEAQAEREMEEFLLAYYGPQQKPMIVQHQGHCAGSPEKCAAFLRGFAAAGVQHFCVRFAAAAQEPQMERFLSEVLPGLS